MTGSPARPGVVRVPEDRHRLGESALDLQASRPRDARVVGFHCDVHPPTRTSAQVLPPFYHCHRLRGLPGRQRLPVLAAVEHPAGTARPAPPPKARIPGTPRSSRPSRRSTAATCPAPARASLAPTPPAPAVPAFRMFHVNSAGKSIRSPRQRSSSADKSHRRASAQISSRPKSGQPSEENVQGM